MFHGFPGGFQQQALLRIHRRGFCFTDPEEIGVEVGDVVQESAPLARRHARHTRLGVVKLFGVPAIFRNLGDQIVPTEQRIPEQIGGVDAPRQPAGHPYDSYRGNACPTH